MPAQKPDKCEKRKREDFSKIPITETKRAASSATVNSSDSPIDRQTKKARNTSQPKPSKTRSQPPRIQETSDSGACLLCPEGRRFTTTGLMIECDTDECGLWYHQSCIFKEAKKPNTSRKMMLFSTEQGMNGTTFVCPDCLDQEDEDKRDAVVRACKPIAESLENLRNTKEAISFESKSPPPEEDEEGSLSLSNQQLLGRSLEEMQWPQEAATILQRPQNEKFQCFQKSVIDDLVRQLDDCIFNYNKEVCDAIKEFGDTTDETLCAPLRSWHIIDARAAMLKGKEWYKGESTDNASQPTSGHTTITASLRQMLQIERGSPLIIPASLEDLNFSQVHRAFISWFVIDILGNNLDIFELPNMKPMRVMMAGVHSFAEERWPRQGRQVLREIQLRTWEKHSFKEHLSKNAKFISGKMETYLEPLTRGFDKIAPWSHTRLRLIEATIRLWSYFEAPNGKFKDILPIIGTYFDPNEHEGHFENGEIYIPDKRSKKRIVWVRRRGFRYAEETGSTLVKAIVLVR